MNLWLFAIILVNRFFYSNHSNQCNFSQSRIGHLLKDGWQQLVIDAFTIVMFGIPLIGYLIFNRWVVVTLRFLVGGFLFVLGLGIDLCRTKTLSAQQSLGDKGKIITNGPYRYTRNPQYVGFIILYSGIILVAWSIMALVTGIFAIFLFFIVPFSEEPWLRQQYGQPYEDYCRMVPRFIGFRSFKHLTSK
jgi:protein-S-isoprenylcysteine O-methyltransferase Ste14